MVPSSRTYPEPYNASSSIRNISSTSSLVDDDTIVGFAVSWDAPSRFICSCNKCSTCVGIVTMSNETWIQSEFPNRLPANTYPSRKTAEEDDGAVHPQQPLSQVAISPIPVNCCPRGMIFQTCDIYCIVYTCPYRKISRPNVSVIHVI